MRWAAVAVVLVLMPLSGCLGAFDRDGGDEDTVVRPSDVGYDPSAIEVTGFQRAAVTIPSFDGVPLAAVVYVPVTADTLPDGSPPRWGTVVFVHGWGFAKEMYEGAGATGSSPPPQLGAATSQVPFATNRLEEFARAGLIAVAYDTRGFGRSGGATSVAGPAEMQDLDAVLSFVAAQYQSNGLFGVTGVSYGGGHSFLAWADNPRVTTAAPLYGWVDLYHSLAPGNVPKAEWAAALSAGVGTAKGQVSPILAEWYRALVTRSDLETVKAQMDARSVLPRMDLVTKPLLVCQGLQETLMPQADLAWEAAGGFTRAIVYTGGHSTDPVDCWPKVLDWFRYFLGGRDTGVHAWPALTSVDAFNGGPLDYSEFPSPVWTTQYLRAPGLANDPSNVSFTIQQRLLSNPFNEPSWVWDGTGLPNNQAPENFRQDPTAVFFESAAYASSEVLMGAPLVRLQLADNETALPYQVTAALYHVNAVGRSTLLSRGAHAALSADDLDGNVLEIRLDWTKADFAPGDTLVLKLGANDASMYMPLPANYSVSFSGASTIELPYFEG